jgi:hypothetical protein
MAGGFSPTTAKRREQLAMIQRYEMYRNGGEGLCLWAEENVRVPVYRVGSTQIEYVYMKDYPKEIWPTTGRSYWTMWQEQKKSLIDAFQMENGLFKHSLVVFCEPRGDGKSFKSILINLWRFNCWPKQSLVLCSNSKELSSFLYYRELQSVIFNSPKILKTIGGIKAVQEKAIRRRDKAGNVVSSMQLISSASGIVSNISGYSYTEFMDNKFPDFFAKLDTSCRNTPNAMGVIDTTVSSKEHKLYELYKLHLDKKDPKLFFYYRFSKTGDYRDYLHPKNDEAQLNSYKERFPLNFAKQFLNLWSAGSEKVFSQEDVEAVNYLGVDGMVNCHGHVIDLVRKKQEIYDGGKRMLDEGLDIYSQEETIDRINRRLWPVSQVYSLHAPNGVSVMAEPDALEKLTDIYDTEWAIIGGIDQADPMKTRTAARSILTVLAKGLPGSLSNPNIGMLSEVKPDEVIKHKDRMKPEDRMPSLSYIYFYLYVVHIEGSSLELLKSNIMSAYELYDGIDVVGGERYGLWDLKTWGEGKGLNTAFEIVHPNYNSQLAFFSYFFQLVSSGRFKGPPSGVKGSKMDDIVREELLYFDHQPDEAKHKFGSPEKDMKYGVQDDFMFATGNGLFAGTPIGVNPSRARRGTMYWGTMMQPGGLIGRW